MIMGLLCMVALSLTSCLDDNDDDSTYVTLTETQRNIVKSNIAGRYTGKIYYNLSQLNYASSGDSIDATWNVSSADSTLIMEFPVSILSNYVYASAVKEAIEGAGYQSIEATIYVPYTMYQNTWNAQLYEYYFYPKEEYFTFTGANGSSVSLHFAEYMRVSDNSGNEAVYYPVWQYMNSRMVLYLLIDEIRVDDTSYSISNGLFIFAGSK